MGKASKRTALSAAFGCMTLLIADFAQARTAAFSRPLDAGMSGSDVMTLQALLKADGYFSYPGATGYYGAATAQAVKALQSANGLEAVGRVGPKTLALLNSMNASAASGPLSTGASSGSAAPPTSQVSVFSQPLSRGSSGDDVTRLQTVLGKLGFLSAAPSGYFGAQTKQAVIAFQQKNDLESVGSTGPQTRKILNALLASMSAPSSAGTQASAPGAQTPTAAPGTGNGTVAGEVGASGNAVPNAPVSAQSSGVQSAPSGGGGTAAPSAPIPGPTLTLSASPSSLAAGGSSTVSWSAANATSCQASGAWSGDQAVAGSQSFGNLALGTSTYSLSCSGPDGSISQSASVFATPAAPAPDVTPPVISNAAPSGALPANTASASLTLATNEPATCAYGISPNAAFSAMTVFPSTGALSHSAPLAGLSNGTSYSYYMSCKDAAGNISPASQVSFSVAAPQVPAPTVSIAALPASVPYGGSSVVSWSSLNASSCAASGGWSGAKGTSGSQTFSGLISSQTLSLACSGTGGATTQSASIAVSGSAPDTTPPSAPAGLTGAAGSQSQVNLSWSASSDNVGVVGYRVYRGAGLVGSPSGTSFADSSLAAGTSYSYAVKAIDAAGNLSASSNVVNVTTQNPPDTSAPTAPGNVSATAVSQSQIALSWSASSDNVGVVGYRVYRGAGLVASPAVLSYADSGLAAGTSYSYVIKAIDAAGNLSQPSLSASASTQAAGLQSAGAFSKTLRAIDMSPVSAGGAYYLIPSQYFFWGNGMVQSSVTIPASGNYSFTLGARASISDPNDIGAIVEVRVDQVPLYVGSEHSLFVKSSSLANYTLSGYVTAGRHLITIAAMNASDPSRQLYVSNLVIAADQSSAPRQAEPAGTRDPWMQPYSSYSIWNTSIGSGAQWSSPTDPDATQLHTLNGGVNSAYWSMPFYLGQASDPLKTFHNGDNTYPVGGQLLRTPAGVAPSPPLVGGDHHIVLFDPSKRLMYNFFGCSASSDGFACGQTQIDDVCLDGLGGYGWGAGVMREWELQQGSINHMLRYSLPTNLTKAGTTWTTGLAWPAQRSDYSGPTAYSGNILYGSTVGIPASVNLSSLGLSQGGMILARALQNYGAIQRDTGGNTGINFYAEQSAESDPLISQMRNDMNKIAPYLEVMRNQGPSSVNGGGARMQATLPGIDPSICGNGEDFYSNAASPAPASVAISSTTPAPTQGDATPPAISSVSASGASQTGAVISWSTNEGASSQVDYGTTGSYGNSSAADQSLVTLHSVSLSGLAAGTTYHYRVRSSDAAGNAAASGDQTFATANAPAGNAPVASPPTTPPQSSNAPACTFTTSSYAAVGTAFGSVLSATNNPTSVTIRLSDGTFVLSIDPQYISASMQPTMTAPSVPGTYTYVATVSNASGSATCSSQTQARPAS